MFSTLLVIAFVAEIQVSLLLVVVMLRAQKLTTARVARVVYLLATATWSAIAIGWELSRDRDLRGTQAWIVVVVAVVVVVAIVVVGATLVLVVVVTAATADCPSEVVPPEVAVVEALLGFVSPPGPTAHNTTRTTITRPDSTAVPSHHRCE